MNDPKKFVKTYKSKKKKIKKKEAKEPKGNRSIINALPSLIKTQKFFEEFKKSTYDFRDAKVSIDAQQHATAEQTAPPELIEYLKRSIDSDLTKIPMDKGLLTVFTKDRGLYSGFFQDGEGQVIEKFDDMTIPILAKNLEIKQLYTAPRLTADPSTNVETAADIETAEDVMDDMLSQHRELYHQGQNPGEPINNGKGSLRIKMGDIDIEIKKSINGFIKNYKAHSKNTEVIKALQSWRRNCVAGKVCRNNLDAAQTLLAEWDSLSEEFYQILHAMKQKKNE